MSPKAKKLLAMLAIAVVVANLTLVDIKVAHSIGTGGKIDLYTQKEPFGGKGPNMPSDAFDPDEVVILYALVTYDEVPLQNSLVTFNVKIPCNESFTLTAKTNSSGIATVDFGIPQVCSNETMAFGEWFASASVLINGMIFEDTLTFRVGWIVQLISVKTIYENLTYGTAFGVGGDVGLQIALESIAMTLNNATLAITIQDVLNVPINSSIVNNFEVPPNERLTFVYFRLGLPKWSHVGEATVLVSALKSDGSPYCPGISTNFAITISTPLTIDFHDVAVVTVLPSARSIQVGQSLSLETIVRNQGTVTQDFNVSTYFDDVLLGTSTIIALLPYSIAAFNFTVNLSLLTVGNHTISASIPPIPDEADLTGNNFSDVVEVTPVIIHDIGITHINVSNTTVFIGDMVQINVTVLDTGTEVETFNVSTYYNSSLIETRLVTGLGPGSQVVINFTWNTTNVHEGSYQISASAPLQGDPTPWDNTLADGIVQIKAKSLPPVKWYTLTIIATTGGTTDPAPGLYNYTSGISVEVKAIPNANYTLNHWELDNVNIGSASPCSVIMDGNHTLEAVFSAVPTRLLIPEMLFLALLSGLVVLFGIFVFFALFYMLLWRRIKRKKKKLQEGVYTVIVHPHI